MIAIKDMKIGGMHHIREKMYRENLICLAEDFNVWLDNMAEKYNCNKNDIQALIKQFLM